MKVLLVWAQLLGLFGACHCAAALSFARVDLGRGVAVRAGGHLDDLQLLPAVANDDAFCAVAGVDQLRQARIQLVDGGLIQGVDVHGWSFVSRLSENAQPQPIVGAGLSYSFVSSNSIVSTLYVFESRRAQASEPQSIGVETSHEKSPFVFNRVVIMLVNGSGETPSSAHCRFPTGATGEPRFITTPKSST